MLHQGVKTAELILHFLCMSKMLTENQILKVISYVISAHGIPSSMPFLPTEMHQLCHS